MLCVFEGTKKRKQRKDIRSKDESLVSTWIGETRLRLLYIIQLFVLFLSCVYGKFISHNFVM